MEFNGISSESCEIKCRVPQGSILGPPALSFTLYYSLVYPYVIYYISVWGSTYQCYLSRIIVLQKMIRIVSKVSFDSHADDLFNEHKILKFSDIYFQIIFVILFTLASQIHIFLIFA